ncbi:MAG: PilZ domain-containing protein, partial [Candidatus Eremiobacteraeota bacterium]|nr:PilZ domain-containing protein [Candidatus Eremiobacteraeota bacterium]
MSVSGFPRPLPAMLLDLSEGGCRVGARSILLTGSTIAFELPIPGKRGIPLRGTVRHIAPSRNPGEVEFGVEFGTLARDDAAALAAFIEEKRRQSPGDTR